jgi:hypothetical protein
MKRIRDGALGAVLIAAGTMLAFLGMTKPARTAPVSADVTSTSSTMPTGENAYCAKGDIWTGAREDGPAQLPQGCVYTGLDGSPSPGKVTSVAAGGDVVNTVRAASCGDTIKLQQGATYTLKSPMFPSKNCDSKHWITIRTSAADSALPPEHARINPSYAGVASLSGRPKYSGPNKNVMAKLVVGASAIQLGDHYRLIGLEITRPKDGQWHNSLVQFAGSHSILDRTWIHGDPIADTTHLVQSGAGSDHVAIINSYLTDAHCKAVPNAICFDAQAWSDGGHGTVMKAYNNFMEAAGENILFGGATAETITSDVEIRLNHLFKPLIWNPLDKNFIGIKFTVKNNFELKQGQRILVEGNILENSWGGFTQNGANIVLTPKNQSGVNGSNICPICFVSHVTMRYNYVVHGAQGLRLANARSDNGGWSLGGHNYSIHDMVFDGMQYSECYQCANSLNELSSGYFPVGPPPAVEVMHDVTLDHLTIVNTGFVATGNTATGFMVMNGPPKGNKTATPRMDNIQWTNSIVDAGSGDAFPTGGGSTNCAVGEPTVAARVTSCWTGASSFTGNLLVTDHASSPLVLPSGNSTTSAWSKVGFVSFNGGDGGDYRLQQSSQYHLAGTDRKDLGADINSVNVAKSFAH